MKHFIVLSAALSAAAVLVVPAYAEIVTDNAVLVTATRTAQTVDDTLAAVTVIGRDQIERSQAKTVAELVTGTPGIDSTVSGGFGKITSLSVRGTSSSQVLVLIDGIKIGSATTGATSWEFLPLSQIERIEIVRGPLSSLYGSEAIGGVIHIFTRRGKDKGQKNIAVGAGTYDTYEASVGISGSSPNTEYSFTAAHFITEGFDAREPIPGMPPFEPPLDESDNDGYRNDSVTTSVNLRLSNGTKIGASLFHAEGDTEFDGTFQNEADFIQSALGAHLTTTPSDDWTVKLKAGRSRDDQDNFLDGTFASNFDTTRDTASWQNDITLSAQQLLTLGIDYQKDRVASSTNFAVNERDNTGYFAQFQDSIDKHSLLLGFRQDDNQQFGKHDTGNAAWGYAINENLRYTLSYGTAFKAPTFNDLYFPGFGNPNLKPEKSKTVETGLQGNYGRGRWDIRAFQTSINDLIVFDLATFLPKNIDEARIVGLETALNIKLGNWITAINLTLLDPRDKNSDKVLPRRAKQTLKIDADRVLGKLQFGASVLAQSHRFDDVPNNDRLGGYGLVNLRAQYEPAKHWFLRATLNNLFDKAYQTVKTYNSAGRAIFLSVGYRAQGS